MFLLSLLLMLRLFLPITLFLLVSAFAEEEIVIKLSSQESLSPIYIQSIEDKKSGFSGSYLKQLEEVLKFDLDHNGHTEITQNKDAAEYLLKPVVENRKFSLLLSFSKKGTAKRLEEIGLTGDLSEDRKQMHKAADTIHQTLFGTLGIADTRILYTVRTKKGTDSSTWVTEVWESDYDGCNPQKLTDDGCLCVTPTYIPGKQGHSRNFLYVSYKIGQPKIYVADVCKKTAQRLSYLRGNQLMPMISPQKDKIAFISDVTGNPDLFIQDFSMEEGLTGKPRQIFCAPNATQGTPSFSPDGKQLAFVSNKDGTPRIYTLHIPPLNASIKELKATLISKRNRSNTCPSWSPDGTKIAYSAMTNGVRQIWIYDFIECVETQLTDGYGHKDDPTWAPNSLHLMFNSSTDNSSELYLINLNQKKAVKISKGPGEKRFPAWETFSLKKM